MNAESGNMVFLKLFMYLNIMFSYFFLFTDRTVVRFDKLVMFNIKLLIHTIKIFTILQTRRVYTDLLSNLI